MIDDYVNHKCNPNCVVSFPELFLVAVKKIKKGEELSFNYCTTEYDLEHCSFKCRCGAENCIGEVKGFKHLPLSEQMRIKNLLLPYLVKKIDL